MKRIGMGLAVLSGAVSASLFMDAAFGQKKKEHEKVTVFDFEATDVMGEKRSPEGFFILDREQMDFKSQILIRKNFTYEIIQSANDL